MKRGGRSQRDGGREEGEGDETGEEGEGNETELRSVLGETVRPLCGSFVSGRSPGSVDDKDDGSHGGCLQTCRNRESRSPRNKFTVEGTGGLNSPFRG